MINLKSLFALTVIVAVTFMTGCFPSNTVDYDDGDGNGNTIINSKVTYTNIFPFAQSGKTWEYKDEDGNDFKISVIDTISDDGDLYYKVEFREIKLDMVQDDWFISEQGSVKYNDKLNGEYSLFLPASYMRNGGTFNCGSSTIDYEIVSSFAIGTKTYTDVLKLTYSTAVLHGFDEIYFADNIGIIQMIDYDGRWPVYYSLQ